MQFYGRGERRAAGIRAGQKVIRITFLQRFLRSKSLVQDSTREPNCHAIRACPAAFPPPFLFPESAPSAEMMPVHHQEDAAAIALASACCRPWHSAAGFSHHRHGAKPWTPGGRGRGLKMPLPIRKSAAGSNFLRVRAISIVYLQQCT